MSTTATSRLERYRERRDEFMRTHENSPLTESQKANFVPLAYYPENPDLVFVLDVDTSIPNDPVELPTTTGESKEYIPYGRVTFNVGDEEASLTIYRERGKRRLLIPFRDATSGKETYGAGRTVDVQERPDGKVTLDFNYAYGLYCQYNDNWVCTIPPMENWLRVPIEAGEKTYPGKESELPD